MAKAGSVTGRHVFVRGHVQGVAFRWSARDRARELGLGGWVRNRPDGSVEVWAEGTPDKAAELLIWLEGGPPAARVEGLEVRTVEPRGFEEFSIDPEGV